MMGVSEGSLVINSLASLPATEWILVVSSASCRFSGGRMDVAFG